MWCSRLSPVIQRLDERVEGDEREEDAAARAAAPGCSSDSVWSRQLDLPARRHEAQRAVGEADVPVGLGARRDRGGVVRAVDPDRVDREERRDQHDHAEHDEEEPAGLRSVHRHDRVAHDVVVRAAGAGELRVLVDDHQQQVHAERRHEDRGQQQDVQRVEAADDRRCPGTRRRRAGTRSRCR